MMTRARLSIYGIVVVLILGGGFLLTTLVSTPHEEAPVLETVPTHEGSETNEDTPALVRTKTIGSSVEGRAIEVYQFGTGDTHLLFVGGIHGGYEWNSVVLAYALIDHLTTHPSLIPEAVTVDIIPSLNPDGVYRIVGKEGRLSASDVPQGRDTSAGRFNAHGVDLNRNFACKWQPEAFWRGKAVGAGTGPFSEPEAATLRTFIEETHPQGVVFWHSKANAVYASECEEGILPETRTLMELYAHHAGYTAVDTFDAYPVTGDAEGWLASIHIPAITVELASHEDIEWEKNIRGITAILETY